MELGCWGPVVQCNIGERVMVDGHGGCMQSGGICIGCTMPGFPDKFSPMHVMPPPSVVSGRERVPGGFSRRMERVRRNTRTVRKRPGRGVRVGAG